ncbi:MAG: FlgD immunoglobulin-like domain containing protein [Candidatus Eiseniibacteriota bacterium]|jgi:hypothetical protein
MPRFLRRAAGRAESVLVALMVPVALATLVPAPGAVAKTGRTDQLLEPGRTDQLLEPGRYQRSAQRTVDLATGLVISAFQLEAGPYAGAAESQARAYLREWGAPFGLNPAAGDVDRGLRLAGVRRGPWGDHVEFQQAVGGVPVLDSDVVVTVRRADGRVTSVMSRYRPAGPADAAAPLVAPADAQLAAAMALGATPVRSGRESIELAYRRNPDSRSLTLVYRVGLPAVTPLGDWEVLVSATSGAVLGLRDRAVHATGSGRVFDPDPLTTAEVAYGTPGFVDGNDASTPELEAQTMARLLPDLTFTSGAYHLDGPHCRLVDFEPPSSAPFTAPDPDGFHLTRDAQGFEDVLVYWGIDMSQRWIQALGFSNIQNGPIECDPHGLNGADNSHYLPSTNRLAWGEGGVDDAEDLDVVLHEYGHAIQHAQVPGWGGGEEGAMGEGFGDYWAGSYSAAVSGYQDDWVFNWDGHNPFWPGRVLDYPATYPSGMSGSIHQDGQIWSSNLMLVWRETCREVVDRATIDHHFALGSWATMPQAAAAWIQSDQNLHEGLNVDTFVYFSTLRGFVAPGEIEVPQTTHTPLVDTADPGPYPVVLTATSPSGVTGVELRYGIDGVIDHTVAMSPTGNPNEWAAAIPSLGSGITVSYYAVADNAVGFRATVPRPAPCGDVHHFEVLGSSSVLARAAPGHNALELNRPNPFNPATTLVYSLAVAGRVRLAIHDVEGRRVRLLVDAEQAAERFTIAWDGRDDAGRDVASGVYLCRLEGPGFTVTRKMVLVE